MSIVVRGGRIIDPYVGLDIIGDLWIENNVIKELGKQVCAPPNTPIIDASGFVVCPGFIDMHCHLREPDETSIGEHEKETIATGTSAAAKGGFTTVCAMPNTRPPIDNRIVMEFLMDIAREKSVVNVLPIACITKDRSGVSLTNMEDLAEGGAIGFSDDGSPLTNDGLMCEALIRAKSLGLPIINHCEDLSMSDGGVMNDGALAIKLGLKGWPPSAEETMVARDIAAAEFTGGHIHIAHVSTAGSVDLVRKAKERGVSVTAEVTPHHLTITEEYANARQGYHFPHNTNAKVNPPLRTQHDVDALVRGLADGTIDCIATDHAPHTRSDKECTFQEAAFGISGLETALGSTMTLVHQGLLSMTTLIERLTAGPGKILNEPDLFPYTLKPGLAADVTVFSPNTEWVVDTSTFASKGKNTPLEGMKLIGKVMITIVAGQIAYRDSTARIE